MDLPLEILSTLLSEWKPFYSIRLLCSINFILVAKLNLVIIAILLSYFRPEKNLIPTKSPADLEWRVPIWGHLKWLQELEPSGHINIFSDYETKTSIVHVARVNLDGKYICGQFNVRPLDFLYGDAGVAMTFNAFTNAQHGEILKFPDGTISWIQWDDKKRINKLNVINCGVWPPTGEVTHPCRVFTGMDLVLGAFVPSTGKCYIPLAKREVGFGKFEVMTQNFLGVVLDDAKRKAKQPPETQKKKAKAKRFKKKANANNTIRRVLLVIE